MSLLDIIRVRFGNNNFVKTTLNPVNQLIRRYCNYRLNKKFKRNGLIVFKDFVNVMKDINVVFWPEFGSLLGLYREHDFIPHDNDFDFGAFVEDRDRIHDLLLSKGYELKHSFYCPDLSYVKEDTFIKHGIGIDVFYFYREGNTDSCYTFLPFMLDSNNKMKYKIKVFKFNRIQLKEVEFKGEMVYIPADTKDHLIVSYGKNFMTPDPNFKSINFNFVDGKYAYQIHK